MTDTAHYTTRRKGFIAGHIRHLGRPASRLVAQVESRRGPITVQDHVQDQLCVALVVHKSQGVTCDRLFVLGDDTFTIEMGYTSLTRGRLSNQVYLVAPEHEVGHGQAPEVDPVSSFTAALHRSGAKTAAIDHMDHPGVDL